jgi:hypothetical protein
MDVKFLRYGVKHGAGYWQLSGALRARGAKALSLGKDGPTAWAKALAAYEAALKIAAEPEPLDLRSRRPDGPWYA